MKKLTIVAVAALLVASTDMFAQNKPATKPAAKPAAAADANTNGMAKKATKHRRHHHKMRVAKKDDAAK